MSDKVNDYGVLLNKDIKLHRLYFKQMSQLLGINCIYRAPLKATSYDERGDLRAKYTEPTTVSVIFQEHPDQKTLKKMGWVSELQESSSIIHVPYDLPGLEVGALFDIPSGLDDGKARTFRVISMNNIMVYPASIACEIAPEYQNTVQLSETDYFANSNFNVLKDNDGDD